MRRRNVRLIAAKELLDTLRDRRTLFVALVLPLLLYPALLLGLTQIIGATQRNLQEERQRVLLDLEGDGWEEMAALLRAENLEPVNAPVAAASLRGRMEELREQESDETLGRLRSTMNADGLAVALLFEGGFSERVAEFTQARLSVLFDPTDEPSRTAQQKVRTALGNFVGAWREALHKQYPDEQERLLFAEEPVQRAEVQVATSSQKGAYSFAPMLGLLIVIMALTGAFYPAIDLAAGEKERGTMETLLVAPVTRTEIVLGKFTAIWVIAVVTALANLFVMGLTFSKLAGMIAAGGIDFSLPASALLAVTAILLPTTALFGAVALALSSFATSYKEGQHYLSPVFLVAMPLAMVGLLPGVEINYGLALVPIANVVLLVKAMLLGGEVLGPGLLATFAVAIYAALALRVAVAIFKRESVLFRTGSGKAFDAAGLRASREGLPTEGLALVLFFAVLALMFFLAGDVETKADALKAILFAQASVLVPTLLLTRRFRLDFRKTLRLYPLRARSVPVVIATAVFALIFVLGAYRMLPRAEPKGMERVFELLGEFPTWQLFILLAILPPICEEILCRGFLLSAFRVRRGAVGAVFISAALFGILHLDFYRFPGTFAVGLVLGYVLMRTGSLLGPILFHLVYNSLIALSDTIPVLGGGLAGVDPAVMALAAVGLAACALLLDRGRTEQIDNP